MRAGKKHIDRLLLLLVSLLVVAGGLIFASAAFGLVARGQVGMSSVLFNHLVLGLGVGLVLLVALSHIDYHVWKVAAPYLFGVALVATALVFVPHIGAFHGGGRRWIVLGRLSLQPSEGLKLTGVIMAASYFSMLRGAMQDWRYRLGGFFVLCGLPALLLILQPDLGTLGVVVTGIGVVFFMAGARWRDVGIVLATGFIALALLATLRPYVRDRVMTFFHPQNGQQAEGYQIRQSLIAIGSGGVFGRGFGQGVQKFTYLPEPMGDSIFAVAGEELGFVGASVLISLFLALALRGFTVAARAPDLFGALLGTGLAATLTAEAFINISAMLGVLPLTGIPLTFVSQGGSAILISLASAGIVLNISRHARTGAKIHA
jgi:cell division protein FtsW